MKKCLFIALAVFVSCNNSDKKQITPQAVNEPTGADCPPMVKFLAPDKSRPSTDASREIYPQQKFIFESGLPAPDKLNFWKQAHTIEEGISLYKAYLKANASHEYINVFRQFGSYIILTQLGLLQQKNASEDIFFFTNELAESKYEGGCLIYACLVQLKAQGYDQNKITECKERFMHYLADVKPPVDSAVVITPEVKIPPQKRVLMKKSIEIKKANQQFISLISAF